MANRKSATYLDEVPRLGIRDLYAAGILPNVRNSRGTIEWPEFGLSVDWEIRPCGPSVAELILRISCPAVDPARQEIHLRKFRQTAWLFIDDENGTYRWVLYCDLAQPPLRFAPSAALGLKEPSRRVPPPRRALAHLHVLRVRLEKVRPDSPLARRLQSEIAEAEANALIRFRNNKPKRKKGATEALSAGKSEDDG